jgi:hypothetical protein
VHANNPGQRSAEELKVAHHGNRPALLILASDSHRPVDFPAEFAAEVLERLWQGRDVRWPTVGRFKQRPDKAGARRSTREHQPPRLDVRIRWRQLGQGKSFIHQRPRRWLLWQKHPRRMALSDGLIKV